MYIMGYILTQRNYASRQIIRAPTPPDMPRIPAERRAEDGISEYLVEVAGMNDD